MKFSFCNIILWSVAPAWERGRGESESEREGGGFRLKEKERERERERGRGRGRNIQTEKTGKDRGKNKARIIPLDQRACWKGREL